MVFAGRTYGEEPRQTSVRVEIPTLDDQLDEADGAVTVRLLPSTCRGCLDADEEKDYELIDQSGDGGRDYRSATVAILDNDLTPLVSIADAEAVEDEGTMAFAVTLDRAVGVRAATVDWATADGPGPNPTRPSAAVAGTDYTAASGTLTFARGDTAHSISVAILDNEEKDHLRRLTVNLTNPRSHAGGRQRHRPDRGRRRQTVRYHRGHPAGDHGRPDGHLHGAAVRPQLGQLPDFARGGDGGEWMEAVSLGNRSTLRHFLDQRVLRMANDGGRGGTRPHAGSLRDIHQHPVLAG